jgi:hypothetical protein
VIVPLDRLPVFLNGEFHAFAATGELQRSESL